MFSQGSTEYYTNFCLAQVSCNNFFFGNIYGVMCIALDRFLMVQFPAWHRNNFNTKTVIALLLMVNVAIHTTHQMLMFRVSWPSNGMTSSLGVIIGNLYFYVVIPEFFIVSALSVLAYVRVLYYLYTKHHQVAPAAEMGRVAPSQSEAAQQAAATKMVCIILVIYFVCYVPMVVVAPIVLINQTPLAAKIFHVSRWVALINSWANPMIYAWRSVDFKDAFIKILTCK